MTNADMISKLAKDNEITAKVSHAYFVELFKLIADELKKGDSVRISDFGTFEVRNRAARKGRNPQTGEEITIAARKTVGFKPAKAIRAAIN